jgi:hypothetical protein
MKSLSLFVLMTLPLAAAEMPRFEPVVLDADIGKVCYAVTTADVNGDGKLDVVAVSENRVQWYENPSWTKHVILEDQTERDNVCIAAHDIDGDGKVDFALGAGWTKIGTIQWITRGDNPDDKWKVHLIGQETSLHRMSFADVLGTGKPQLVISPLTKTVAEGVRLTAFEIPKQPKTDRWPPTVLDATLNRMHGHTHVEWNNASPIETIVAAEQGVFLISRDRNGGFVKSLLGAGMEGTTPETRGAGEIKVGKLPGGERFLATVEPMHGTAAVVYLQTEALGPWKRVVLDEMLKQGHAVWMTDLDGDGGDEIVIGHREPGPGPVVGPGLYVFQARNNAGTEWTKHVIDDGGVAVEDALAADFNGDGKPDLVAGGRATHNVKLYWNRGPKSFIGK